VDLKLAETVRFPPFIRVQGPDRDEDGDPRDPISPEISIAIVHRVGWLRVPGSGQISLFNGHESSEEGSEMSVAKVIEITAQSPESFEAAVEEGIQRSAKTVENIQGVWVKEFKADVEDGEVTMYRVDMKVTFILN
jgi:flavin-binding protein dodecin